MFNEMDQRTWAVVSTSRPLILDVGGEGRHPLAWNVNPSRLCTYGPRRGKPIPRWIQGRADKIPLPDRVVDLVLMERAPLTRSACLEIRRVIRTGGRIVLRHARPFGWDPHGIAREVLSGTFAERECEIGARRYQELAVTIDACNKESGGRLPGKAVDFD